MSKENTEKRKEYHKNYREAENLAQIFFAFFLALHCIKWAEKVLIFD